MYRTGELTKPNYPSSSSSGANEKLKQKKRLSFREPEVETPHNSSWSNSNRIQAKQSALPAPSVDKPRRSTSLEDLTLEDQTFIIAKHVGQAFDKRPNERKQLSPSTALKTSSSESRSIRRNSCFLSDTLKNDCSRLENGLQKYGSNTRAAITSEDAQYFEALSPPVTNISTMKFPAIEVSESGSSIGKSNHAALVPSSDVVSTSVQHQMQFLKYQLEQQRQQTQAALAHIQLLKDQLQAESSARYKAQTQNHQLIMQNKELLDHIQNLFQQIQDLEKLVLEKQERKSTFPSSSSSSTSQETQITESTITNAFRAQKNNENHPAKASGFAEAATTNAITTPKNGGHPAKTSASTEANKTNAITAQINTNVNSSPAKISAFAPNPIMANRRSSLTSIKPFQSKANYLEPSSRLSSRDTSPIPTSPVSKNPPLPDASETSISNANGGRSFLFKSTQRYYENKESSTKERNDDTTQWRNVTKTTEKQLVSPITLTDFTLKNTPTSNPKSVTNNELHIQDENLVLNDNPFLIEEKRPGKLEGYASRKNNSSEGSSTKISSVALSPKSYSTWSKSSKFHKNDSVTPLAYENTSDLCIKETQRFSSGNSRLFNS